jgi:septal ring factor EnvC (AmiA/AmiB activator)
MLARCVSVSFLFAALVSFAMVFCVSFASAQQTPPTTHDKSQDARLDAIEKKLGDQDEKLSTLTDKIDRLVGGISDQKGQIESLRTGISELKDIVKQGLDNHDQILTQIAQSDGGRYIPRLSAAMAESESFRRDMAMAVNGLLPVDRREYERLRHPARRANRPRCASRHRDHPDARPGHDELDDHGAVL